MAASAKGLPVLDLGICHSNIAFHKVGNKLLPIFEKKVQQKILDIVLHLIHDIILIIFYDMSTSCDRLSINDLYLSK